MCVWGMNACWKAWAWQKGCFNCFNLDTGGLLTCAGTVFFFFDWNKYQWTMVWQLWWCSTAEVTLPSPSLSTLFSGGCWCEFSGGYPCLNDSANAGNVSLSTAPMMCQPNLMAAFFSIQAIMLNLNWAATASCALDLRMVDGSSYHCLGLLPVFSYVPFLCETTKLIHRVLLLYWSAHHLTNVMS